MIQWILKPNDTSLLAHVENYWFLDTPATSGDTQYPKLNPEPCAHLLLCPNQQAYRYLIEDKVYAGTGSHWLFAQTNTLTLDHSQKQSIVGVKFKVGATYGLTGSVNHPQINQVVECNLKEIGLTRYPNSQAIVDAAATQPDTCQTLLDTTLLPWLSKRSIDKHAKLTDAAMQLLPNHTIKELPERLYCTIRTLERSFSRATGFTLKQCQSMLKFEALLQHLQTIDPDQVDWVELAFAFGFSDQPHLIRYVKSQIGETPGKYAQQRNLAIDRYGGVEMLRRINL